MRKFTERILRAFQSLKRRDIARLLMEIGKTTIAISFVLAVITANPLMIIVCLTGATFILIGWGISRY